jgi:hypothetical protein
MEFASLIGLFAVGHSLASAGSRGYERTSCVSVIEDVMAQSKRWRCQSRLLVILILLRTSRAIIRSPWMLASGQSLHVTMKLKEDAYSPDQEHIEKGITEEASSRSLTQRVSLIKPPLDL